jgi:hypothetical protein
MKIKNISLAFISALLMGCMGFEMPDQDAQTKEKINQNVEKIFGTQFASNQTWCTTSSGSIVISNIPSGTDKVQLLAYIAETDTTTSLKILNEIDNPKADQVTMNYDIPSENLGMYVALISENNFVLQKVKGSNVSFARAMMTRGVDDLTLPSVTPTIGLIEDSWAAQRGWIEGEKLYQLADYSVMKIPVNNYSETDITSFRALIFSYFKNGREYNNLPLVTGGGYYNANAYPITTGTKPIILSPIYKSDKAKQYGNEVWNSDLYYYYFKDSDIEGKTDDEQVAFFESLPKYKAIEFKQHFGETEDDVIEKRTSYALMYFGDGTPELGTEGSFEFPQGYKVGFMVRAKTEFKENGKPRKQGELYGDGRLNVNINGYSECNFKGSFKDKKLPLNSPRVAWLVLNGKVMMCWESGTDRDFNDIIIEVEGGIEPVSIIPELDNNYYTFCFEDREIGDYDLNDVVIKGRRIDETHVEYSIIACGAQDKLEVRNIGNLSGVEIHSLFGYDGFINTTEDEQNFEPQTVVIEVDKNFSFLNTLTQPFLYDKSTNKYIYLSKVGEDPHGIMIPYDFKYPLERVCIKDAYEQFNSWGQNSITSNEWYKFPVEGKTF